MEIDPKEANIIISSLAAMLAAEDSNQGRIEFRPVEGATIFTMVINWNGLDTTKELIKQLREVDSENARLKVTLDKVKYLPTYWKKVTPPSDRGQMKVFIADLEKALPSKKP
jgi:hypothetical protein